MYFFKLCFLVENYWILANSPGCRACLGEGMKNKAHLHKPSNNTKNIICVIVVILQHCRLCACTCVCLSLFFQTCVFFCQWKSSLNMCWEVIFGKTRRTWLRLRWWWKLLTENEKSLTFHIFFRLENYFCPSSPPSHLSCVQGFLQIF